MKDYRLDGKRVIVVATMIVLGGTFAIGLQNSTDTDLLKTADEILKEVVRIRGLELKGPVQKGIKNKEEIAQYLRERIRDEYDVNELRREGKVLKKLGLIPQEMDYQEFILKLLTEQVGGYYDPDKKTFFISSWLPLEQQKPVMAHELTHALQDQHFGLNRFIKQVRKMENDDMVLARQALVEGEGMAVMFDYLLQPVGKTFAELPAIVTVMRSQLATVDSQFEVFKNAPMFLKETLLFPYGYGAAFLQKIRSKEPWSSVNRIYSDLPESTEQIIHPEKYFDVRDKPRPVEIEDPSARLGKEWRISYRNVLGEFTTYLLLKLFLSEEESLKGSSGWDGDRLLLLEKDGSGSCAVFQESVWDSPEDAGEFYQALSRWLQQRFPRGKQSEDASGGFAWKDGGEYHSIQRNGARIRLIVGLPQEYSSKFKNY